MRRQFVKLQDFQKIDCKWWGYVRLKNLSNLRFANCQLPNRHIVDMGWRNFNDKPKFFVLLSILSSQKDDS